jgi:hypothetical protein
MLRVLAPYAARLGVLLALGGCIQSSHDIAEDGLSPQLPLLSGDYKEDEDHSAKVTRSGDGYTVLERTKRTTKSGKIKAAEETHHIRFFSIPEFPNGYIIQENVENVRYAYCFAEFDDRRSAVRAYCPDGRDWPNLPRKLRVRTRYTGTKADDFLFNDIKAVKGSDTLPVLREIAKLGLKMSYGRTFVRQ